MREVYQNDEDTNGVDDMPETLAKEGARGMLAAARVE